VVLGYYLPFLSDGRCDCLVFMAITK